MKKFTNLFIIIFMLFFYSSSYAGWADEWLGTMLTENPSSYEGQQRGYFSGGGFTARKKMHTDYLLSIQGPKINIGCGGIDIFLGSFSFLNPDYLVEKATRIIQAAPAYAFELALSNLCESCANIMNNIQNIIDKLNSLQLDECKASKALVTIGSELIQNHESATLNSLKTSIQQGYQGFFTQAKKDAADNPVQAQKNALDNINATVTKLKDPVGKSFLETFKNDTGLKYVDEVRALVGDILIDWDAKRGLVATYVPSCDNANIKEYVEGKILKKDSVQASCVETSENYRKKVETHLNSILDKMKNSPQSALAQAEKDFINLVDFPLYSLLRDSVMFSPFQAESDTSKMILPIAYAYAYGVLNSIYSTLQKVIQDVKINIDLGNKDNLLITMINQMKEMLDQIDKLKNNLKGDYDKEIKTLYDIQKNNLVYKQNRDAIKKAITKDMFKKK